MNWADGMTGEWIAGRIQEDAEEGIQPSKIVKVSEACTELGEVSKGSTRRVFCISASC